MFRTLALGRGASYHCERSEPRANPTESRTNSFSFTSEQELSNLSRPADPQDFRFSFRFSFRVPAPLPNSESNKYTCTYSLSRDQPVQHRWVARRTARTLPVSPSCFSAFAVILPGFVFGASSACSSGGVCYAFACRPVGPTATGAGSAAWRPEGRPNFCAAFACCHRQSSQVRAQRVDSGW